MRRTTRSQPRRNRRPANSINNSNTSNTLIRTSLLRSLLMTMTNARNLISPTRYVLHRNKRQPSDTNGLLSRRPTGHNRRRSRGRRRTTRRSRHNRTPTRPSTRPIRHQNRNRNRRPHRRSYRSHKSTILSRRTSRRTGRSRRRRSRSSSPRMASQKRTTLIHKRIINTRIQVITNA